MTTVLAHIGGFHIVLYLSPLFLVGGGLWVAGRYLPDEDDIDLEDDLDLEDDEFDPTIGRPK